MRELNKNLNENRNNVYHQFDFVKKMSFKGTEVKNNYFLNVNFRYESVISGWKIHISPVLTDYNYVLRIVNNICQKMKINYKFIDTVEGYKLFTSKNIPSSQFGKIITIYPNNTHKFVKLLNYFYKYFGELKGMVVPTDHIFKDATIINYRYGGINPIVEINEENDIKSYIFDGNGDVIEDVRKPYFELPSKISNPIKEEYASSNSDLIFKGKENGTVVKIKKMIRQIASGNIYLGEVNQKNVIIKQAKFGALAEEDEPYGTAISLKKNERLFLKTSKIKNIPKYIDYFTVGNDYFLIESKIDGINLRKYSALSDLVKPGNSKEQRKNVNRINSIFDKLKQLQDKIHAQGLIIGDVSPDNFVINNGQVYLIDCETVRPINDNRKYLRLETKIFINNIKATCCDYQKDDYKLGMTMFWVLTQKNKEINNNWTLINYYLNLLVKRYPNLEKSKKLILSLIEPYIIKNKKENFTINKAIRILKRQLIDKLKFNNSFITTPYVQSNLSLLNGISGILLYSKKKGLMRDEDEYKWRRYILNAYNQDLTSVGLFFGKMGIALTLAELKTPFERNKPLLDLLYKLKKEKLKLSSDVANGVSGLLVGFYFLSEIKGYPDFSSVKKDLIKLLMKNYETTENGIEYGKLGVLMTIKFLQKKDKIFSKECTPDVANKIKAKINKIVQDNTNGKYFFGIAESNKHKIIYPNLMTGGAGVLLYYLFFDYDDLKISHILKLYDVAFMVNNGISYGVAGFILPLLLGIKYKKIGANNFREVKKYLSYWEKYILHNFIKENNYYGWSSDQGWGIHDDIGSGNVGILAVLELLKEVNTDGRTTNSH